MVRNPVRCAERLGAALVIATLGTLLLTDCRPTPAAPGVARAVLSDRVILAWQAPANATTAALLDASAGPAARLIAPPGFTNLAALDAALRRLDAVRPVMVPEPAQAGAVRVLVDRRLAADTTRPGLLAELSHGLTNSLAGVRRELSGGELVELGGATSAERTPGLGLALEHRAELFRQLAAAFRERATVPAGAVLTNAPAIAAAHATLAAECAAAVRELTPVAGTDERKAPCGWGSPFGATEPVRLGAFAGEWRGRVGELARWIPAAPGTNAVSRAPVPSGWLDRVARENVFLPRLRQTTEDTVAAWVHRGRGFSPIDEPRTAADRTHNALLAALAKACAADRADLAELERRCLRITPDNVSAELRVAYRDVALAARRAMKSLDQVIRHLEGRDTVAGAKLGPWGRPARAE
jgi:hypothetical protein